MLAILLAGTVAQPALWPSAHTLGAVAIAAGALLVAACIFAVWRSSIAARAAAAVAIVALLAGAAAGYRLQGHYLRGRYVYHPGVSYLARVWALFRTVHDARVGVVGTFGGFFSYPLSGLDSSNSVDYVGRHGPHGSFTPIGSCTAWRAAVNAEHLSYLVTTPARDPWHPTVLGPSPETGWTESDPAAIPVLSERAEGQPIVVFHLRGPLDVAGCSQS